MEEMKLTNGLSFCSAGLDSSIISLSGSSSASSSKKASSSATKLQKISRSEDEKQETKFEDDDEDITSELDKNGDGKISKAEFEAYKKSQEDDDMTPSLDKNGDGKISKSEYDSYNSKSSTKDSKGSKGSDNSGDKSSIINDEAKANGINTTVDDFDTDEFYVTGLDILQDVPYATEITTEEYEDDSLYSLKKSIDSLDEVTEQILDLPEFRGKEIRFCQDKTVELSRSERLLRLEGGVELKICVTRDGSPYVFVFEHSGDPDNPEEGDIMSEKMYYFLSGDYYAVVPKTASTYSKDSHGDGSFKQPLVRSNQFFLIYDGNGNQITEEDNPEEYEKYSKEMEEILDPFNSLEHY